MITYNNVAHSLFLLVYWHSLISCIVLILMSHAGMVMQEHNIKQQTLHEHYLNTLHGEQHRGNLCVFTCLAVFPEAGGRACEGISPIYCNEKYNIYTYICIAAGTYSLWSTSMRFTEINLRNSLQ